VTEPVIIPPGQDPKSVGLLKMRMLSFNMSMTDQEMRDLAEVAIEIKNTYTAWQEFYEQLDLRKKRAMGFDAVVLALDIAQFAAAIGADPAVVTAVLGQLGTAEKGRIAELVALWNAGQLPDRPVLTDPSVDVIEGS
jgi:hypothetical protein